MPLSQFTVFIYHIGKNYEITQAFIRSLEFMAPSAQSVQSMRAHPVYSMFEKRWQLPVYFQMRWKEIVSKVEDALALPVEPSGKPPGGYNHPAHNNHSHSLLM